MGNQFENGQENFLEQNDLVRDAAMKDMENGSDVLIDAGELMDDGDRAAANAEHAENDGANQESMAAAPLKDTKPRATINGRLNDGIAFGSTIQEDKCIHCNVNSKDC